MTVRMIHLLPRDIMAGSDPQPKKATPPRPASNSPRKPLQVMHISKKTDVQIIGENSSDKDLLEQTKDKRFNEEVPVEKNNSPLKKAPELKKSIEETPREGSQDMTMEELLELCTDVLENHGYSVKKNSKKVLVNGYKKL